MRNRLFLLVSSGCWLAAFFFNSAFLPRQGEQSELAALMHKMYAESLVMRGHVLENKPLPDLYREFTAIHTAVPTDSTVRTPAFRAMSEAWLASLKQLYAARRKNRVEAYNLMVQQCLNCHLPVCSGPVRKIQKLEIPATAGR